MSFVAKKRGRKILPHSVHPASGGGGMHGMGERCGFCFSPQTPLPTATGHGVESSTIELISIHRLPPIAEWLVLIDTS